MDIKEFIYAAEKRPLMYMQNVCFYEFLISMDAMLSTKRIHNIEDDFDKIFAENFPSWICKKFDFPLKYSTKWEHIVFLQSVNNEDALYKFFQYFKEFCSLYDSKSSSADAKP